MPVLSPIVFNNRVKFIRDLDTSVIINKYQTQFGVDVSNYFKDLKTISIYECEQTGFRFYYPFNLAGDAAFYEELQQFDWYYSDWKWENTIALAALSENNRVLDVGCGAGQFISRLKENNFEAIGLEFNDASIQKCKEKGLTVFKETIEEHATRNPETYDAVTLFQVLEHIEQPQLFIKDCLKALRKGGQLIIAVPNSNPYKFRNEVYHTLNLPPHHTGLWNKQSLTAFAKHNNLIIKNIILEPPFYIPHYLKINYGLPYRIGSLFKNNNFLKKRIEGDNVVAIFIKL